VLREPLREKRGKLITIKFDSLAQEQPISAIFRGFDAYCDGLQQGDDYEVYQQTSNAVKTALGPSSRILQSQVPSLAGLMGDPAPSLSLDLSNKEMFNSILYCLQVFVRAIAMSSSRPTVILFDDMQWADGESLDLIRGFVSDNSISPILFVGCYRGEEVQGDHPLLNFLGELSLSGVSTWNVFTESLVKENVNELLADTLHLSPRLTAPLAEEIYRKSRGNALFVRQLLMSLFDEHLLRYSPEARRWKWNLDAIRRKTIPDSAVGLVLERMKEYGARVQALLKVAALLGTRFDAATLKLFYSGGKDGGDGSAILPYIDAIVNDGLFVLDGVAYRFAHDQLWQAAYSLTDEEDRGKVHLFIGRQLLHGLNRSNNAYALEEHLHRIVDQLNRGKAQIIDKAWKLKLAELNLQAGKMSVSSCAFIEASIYLLQGCLLISDEDWEGHYDLALELFTTCAEVQVAHGDNDGAIFAANTVCSRSRSFGDKLRACHALILALVANAKMNDALSHCLIVLEGLGEAFPSPPDLDPTKIETELDEMARALSTLRLEDITSRPASSNNATNAKMRFLLAASRISYSSSPSLLILMSLRMVKITMDNGITPESSLAFGSLANVLCGMGFRDQSAFCSRVALALLNLFHNKHSQVVYLALNYSIHPYRSPAQACLDSSERAYSHGMSVGDPDWAYLNVACAVPMNIFAPNSSTKLGEVRSKVEGYVQELRQYKHHMIGFVQIFLQALINFMSHPCPEQINQDPTVLTGDIMNQENVLAMAQQSLNLPTTEKDAESCPYPLRTQRKINFYRLWLAYSYRRYDVVMEMADLVHQNVASSNFYPSFEFALEIFYVGLAAYVIIRRCGDNDNKWLSIANDMTERMEVLAGTECAWNFLHKYELLRAEQAYNAGNVETAISAYDLAIQKAEEHKFINEQALAAESAALFYMEQDQLGHARKHLHLSESLYRAWGAQRKTDDVHCLLQEVADRLSASR
jgi:predicted ATPase